MFTSRLKPQYLSVSTNKDNKQTTGYTVTYMKLEEIPSKFEDSSYYSVPRKPGTPVQLLQKHITYHILGMESQRCSHDITWLLHMCFKEEQEEQHDQFQY